jgi:hypothetical protein
LMSAKILPPFWPSFCLLGVIPPIHIHSCPERGFWPLHSTFFFGWLYAPSLIAFCWLLPPPPPLLHSMGPSGACGQAESCASPIFFNTLHPFPSIYPPIPFHIPLPKHCSFVPAIGCFLPSKFIHSFPPKKAPKTFSRHWPKRASIYLTYLLCSPPPFCLLPKMPSLMECKKMGTLTSNREGGDNN